MWIEIPSHYFRRRLHHPKPEEAHIRKQVCSSKNCTSLIIVFLFRTSKARQPLLGDTRAWDCGFFIREVSHIVQLLFSSFQTGSATIEELMLGRLLHSDSCQAGTSALCAGQRKARQPWWKGRSSARRPCCGFTPPQPGKGGEAGRGRGEQWRRWHQPGGLVSIFALSNCY